MGNQSEDQANNPLLDSRRYEIEYTNEVTEAFAVNTIAENLLVQVDDQGQRNLMMDEIEDHRETAEAVPKERLELALDYRGRREIQRLRVLRKGKNKAQGTDFH